MAYLIADGINTVDGLLSSTGMPKRTLQEVISTLQDFDIIVERHGGTKNKTYSISNWSAIDSRWIKRNFEYVKNTALNKEVNNHD